MFVWRLLKYVTHSRGLGNNPCGRLLITQLPVTKTTHDFHPLPLDNVPNHPGFHGLLLCGRTFQVGPC